MQRSPDSLAGFKGGEGRTRVRGEGMDGGERGACGSERKRGKLGDGDLVVGG